MRLCTSPNAHERTLALYHRANCASPVFLAGPDTRVACLLFTALIWLLQGYLDHALARSREALAAAYELDHAFTTSQALYLTGRLHQVRGEARLVEERARAMMDLATERGLSAWLADGTVLHGWAVAQGGDTDRGIAQLRQGLAAKEAIGVQQHTPGFLAFLVCWRSCNSASGTLMKRSMCSTRHWRGSIGSRSAGSRPTCLALEPRRCWRYLASAPKKPRLVASRPWRSAATRAHGCGSCAPR
jgi:hypothetical protein